MQKNEYMYDELGNNQGSEKEQFENDNNEVNDVSEEAPVEEEAPVAEEAPAEEAP